MNEYRQERLSRLCLIWVGLTKQQRGWLRLFADVKSMTPLALVEQVAKDEHVTYDVAIELILS